MAGEEVVEVDWPRLRMHTTTGTIERGCAVSKEVMIENSGAGVKMSGVGTTSRALVIKVLSNSEYFSEWMKFYERDRTEVHPVYNHQGTWHKFETYGNPKSTGPHDLWLAHYIYKPC